MQTTTQNLSEFQSPVVPFTPEDKAEEVTATIVRMMLKYEVMRIQLQSNLLSLSEEERFAKRQEASAIRLLGFRTQRQAFQDGIQAMYDDELLQREGVRIAYLLARNATDQARYVEEEVVSISVNKALYNIHDDRIDRITINEVAA